MPVERIVILSASIPNVRIRCLSFDNFSAAFRQMKENVLTDSLGILNPFWEKLRLSRLGASADTLRIVHVGDSHIRGHIFPVPPVR